MWIFVWEFYICRFLWEDFIYENFINADGNCFAWIWRLTSSQLHWQWSWEGFGRINKTTFLPPTMMRIQIEYFWMNREFKMQAFSLSSPALRHYQDDMIISWIESVITYWNDAEIVIVICNLHTKNMYKLFDSIYQQWLNA